MFDTYNVKQKVSTSGVSGNGAKWAGKRVVRNKSGKTAGSQKQECDFTLN